MKNHKKKQGLRKQILDTGVGYA